MCVYPVFIVSSLSHTCLQFFLTDDKYPFSPLLEVVLFTKDCSFFVCFICSVAKIKRLNSSKHTLVVGSDS
jgi:hypothetical protein